MKPGIAFAIFVAINIACLVIFGVVRSLMMDDENFFIPVYDGGDEAGEIGSEEKESNGSRWMNGFYSSIMLQTSIGSEIIPVSQKAKIVTIAQGLTLLFTSALAIILAVIPEKHEHVITEEDGGKNVLTLISRAVDKGDDKKNETEITIPLASSSSSSSLGTFV